MPASPNITAVLKYGTTNIIVLTNPSYNSILGLLTWTGSLPSEITVPAGQAIELEISSAEAGVTFTIDYDSQTKPSKIDLPTNTYIDITSLAMYNAAYPGGTLITAANAGSTVYVRSIVTDPFGYDDITSEELLITLPGGGTSNVSPTSVATSGCTRTYEYAWTVPNLIGNGTHMITAKEGFENAVIDTTIIAYEITPSPGGVGSVLSLWLKADAGTSTTTDGAANATWTNSAVSAEVSTAAFGQRPLYKVTSSNLNFNPVLDFDGVDDYFAGTSHFGVAGTRLFTSFVVFRRATDNTSDMFYGGSNSANNTFGFFIHSNDLTIIEAQNINTKSGTNATALAGVGTIKGVNRSASNTWQLYHNGAVDGAAGGISGFGGTLATSNLNIGVGEGTQEPMDGDIAEIIIHAGSLTNADMNRIQSYLALKYGITLDQTTAQNYIGSDGSTVYWNGTANSGYKNNIAGIARDDNSALTQKQSKSINSGLQVVIGNGNTIAASNVANASTFSVDLSALVWGDNAGSVSSWSATGAPAARHKIDRNWRIQESGTVGSVKIQVADNSGTNGLPAEETSVYLLLDADGNFAAGATEIAMTLNGTNWETNVDLTNGQYFSFATEGCEAKAPVLTKK
jgi:hypothetical protein